MVDGVRIDQLDPALTASVNHVFPVMLGGVTEYLTIAQVVTIITAAIVDGSPAALDTLNELAAALGDDPNFAATLATQIGTINTALGKRLRFDAAQALTGPEKTQGLANLGAAAAADVAGFVSFLVVQSETAARRKQARLNIGANLETIYDVNLAGLTQVVWPDLALFDALEFRIEGIGSAAEILLALSADNGATFLTGAGAYFYGVASRADNNAWAYAGGSNSSVPLTAGLNASFGFCISGKLASLSLATTASIALIELVSYATTGQVFDLRINARYTTGIAHNAMRLSLSSGTFTSGKATLKGLRK